MVGKDGNQPVLTLHTEVVNVDFVDGNGSGNRLTGVKAKPELIEEGKEVKIVMARLDISTVTIRKYISTT